MRWAIRSSIRRSASTSASAQRRSIVEEPGRIVRVRRHSATKRRARSSFDVAASASRAIHSRKSRAPRAEKERSEERRVGKEGVSTCRSRESQYHEKKNDIVTKKTAVKVADK